MAEDTNRNADHEVDFDTAEAEAMEAQLNDVDESAFYEEISGTEKTDTASEANNTTPEDLDAQDPLGDNEDSRAAF